MSQPQEEMFDLTAPLFAVPQSPETLDPVLLERAREVADRLLPPLLSASSDDELESALDRALTEPELELVIKGAAASPDLFMLGASRLPAPAAARVRAAGARWRAGFALLTDMQAQALGAQIDACLGDGPHLLSRCVDLSGPMEVGFGLLDVVAANLVMLALSSAARHPSELPEWIANSFAARVELGAKAWLQLVDLFGIAELPDDLLPPQDRLDRAQVWSRFNELRQSVSLLFQGAVVVPEMRDAP